MMPRKRKDEKQLMEELIRGCNSHPDRIAHALFAFTLSHLAFGDNYFGAAVAVGFALIPDLDLFFLHRELLHNLFALFLVPASFNLFFPGTFRYAFLGYGSHLLLDLLSPAGEALLFPFYRGRFGFGIVRSGVPTLIVSIVVFVLVMFFRPFPFIPRIF